MDRVRILVLGGTSFLGRAATLAAVGRGHDVTCAARGVSGAPAAGASFVATDRDQEYGLAEVAARRWDAVVDVARQPRHVARAVRDLAPVTGHYVFVSTVNVYAGWPGGSDDESSTRVAPLRGDWTGPGAYAAAKVACEDLVTAAFAPPRVTLVRPALIGGPGDVSGRSGYWPWRFAHPTGPRVLVPDVPAQPCQILDVRDLADWLVAICERRLAGAFNAAGVQTTVQKTLGLSRRVAGGGAAPLSASSSWLLDHGVIPWLGPRSLPLWLGDDLQPAITSCGPAVAAGLRRRPLRVTLADALTYELGRVDPPPHGAGLTDAEERELIAALLGTGTPGRGVGTPWIPPLSLM